MKDSEKLNDIQWESITAWLENPNYGPHFGGRDDSHTAYGPHVVHGPHYHHGTVCDIKDPIQPYSVDAANMQKTEELSDELANNG